jgi:hypothetical protein
MHSGGLAWLPGLPNWEHDRGESFPGGVELGGDHVLDAGVQRGARAQDELAQGGYQRGVLVGQLGQLRPGEVDDAHGVVGEVRRLDHPGPRAGGQAGRDVLAVLLVLVPARLAAWSRIRTA